MHEPTCARVARDMSDMGPCTCGNEEPRQRYAPNDCPHCEYDRQFPGFERGGWIRQDNY